MLTGVGALVGVVVGAVLLTLVTDEVSGYLPKCAGWLVRRENPEILLVMADLSVVGSPDAIEMNVPAKGEFVSFPDSPLESAL